jgi:hypothetical protein
VRRSFGSCGQKNTFHLIQFLRRLVKIQEGGLRDSPCPVSEIDLVEIHFQDLLLCVFLFIFHGQDSFPDLSLNRLLPFKIFVLDKLLRNRRTALGHAPLDHILYEGAGNPPHIYPAMFVKADILDGDERFLQKDGNLIDFNPVTLIRQNPADESSLAVKYPDGFVPLW